jgi:AraC-like DNA-binding protein
LVKGYEAPPIGRLLTQVLELDRPMGLAYERSVGFAKPMHEHERHMLVCPRGACRMSIGTGDTRYQIDATRALWVPRGLQHDNACTSAIYDTVALFPDDARIDAMIADNGLAARDRARLDREYFLFRRTPWLADVIDRTFAARVLAADTPRDYAFYLEKQLLHEVARVIFVDHLARPTTRAAAPNDLVNDAIFHIEANLFEPLDLRAIAKTLRVSESTLLRNFKAAIGKPPSTYLRERRLDEARALLARGDHQVGDVALLVGYEDVSAFGRAYRARFGETPRARV